MASLLDPLEDRSKDVCWIRKTSAQPERLTSLSPLPDSLKHVLKDLEINSLYSHQAECYRLIKAGQDVIITTPSASGKSLAYQLSVIDQFFLDPEKSGLFLFPTKALTREQATGLSRFLAAIGSTERITIYDGDTPQRQRRSLRGKGRFLFTNPDMLHANILPNHQWWSKFLRGLSLLIVDEFHVYNGIFGSHFANLMRRLEAITKHYQNHYQILATSATISNPKEHARRVFNRELEVINDSGAYEPARYLIAIDPGDESHLGYAAGLIRDYIQYGIHILSFVRTKRECEILVNLTRRELETSGLDPQLVAGYRAGYLDTERRRIERDFADGGIKAIIATSALELGIDIGHLRVTMLVGFPRNIASFWQRIGRAGRRGGIAAAILVATRHPIDQFLLRNPDYLFRHPEHAVCDPFNPEITAAHDRCLNYELPGRDPSTLEMVMRTGGQTPARKISLRSGSRPITIKEHNEVIGELESSLAPLFLHPGAVYLHQGKSYLVRRLDLRLQTAEVEGQDLDYFTEPITETNITVLDNLAGTEGSSLDRIRLKVRLKGYKRIGFDALEVIDEVPIDLEIKSYETIALLIRCDDCRGLLFPLLQVAGLFVLGLPGQDLFGGYTDAGVFVYDAFPGGVGITRELFNNLKEWTKATYELVNGCPCPDGCPSCIGRSGRKKLIVEGLKMLMFRYG